MSVESESLMTTDRAAHYMASFVTENFKDFFDGVRDSASAHFVIGEANTPHAVAYIAFCKTLGIEANIPTSLEVQEVEVIPLTLFAGSVGRTVMCRDENGSPYHVSIEALRT